MRRLLGPILHLRPAPPDAWRFTIGLWVEQPDLAALRVVFDPAAGATVSPQAAVQGRFATGDWVSWTVSIPRQAAELRTGYRLDGLPEGPIDVDHLVVPAVGQSPRIGFFSCNGVQDPKQWTSQPEMERAWARMGERQKQPHRPDGSGGAYHVLIGGGDQLYCDAVWSIDELKPLRSWAARKAAPVTPALRLAIERTYAQMYQRWTESIFSAMHARVPGLYMWDDHDIFDGWGSYDDHLQRCDLFQAIFDAARRAFVVFQLGGAPPRPPCRNPGAGHFLQAMQLDDLDVVLLDLRSDRTAAQVMSAAQWTDLHAYLAERAGRKPPAPHLLVVSTIPLVYLNFGVAEHVLAWLPSRQEMEDDLRDQWESPAHQEERDRLVMTLLDHAARTRTRVSVLSGDVHVGARGRIVSRRPAHLLGDETESIVHQLTSSGIVFTPPTSFEMLGMRLLGKEGPLPLASVSGVATEVVRLSPQHVLLGRNNWLSVEPDLPDAAGHAPAPAPGDDGGDEPDPLAARRCRLWIRWSTADDDVAPPLVIHAR